MESPSQTIEETRARLSNGQDVVLTTACLFEGGDGVEIVTIEGISGSRADLRTRMKAAVSKIALQWTPGPHPKKIRILYFPAYMFNEILKAGCTGDFGYVFPEDRSAAKDLQPRWHVSIVYQRIRAAAPDTLAQHRTSVDMWRPEGDSKPSYSMSFRYDGLRNYCMITPKLRSDDIPAAERHCASIVGPKFLLPKVATNGAAPRVKRRRIEAINTLRESDVLSYDPRTRTLKPSMFENSGDRKLAISLLAGTGQTDQTMETIWDWVDTEGLSTYNMINTLPDEDDTEDMTPRVSPVCSQVPWPVTPMGEIRPLHLPPLGNSTEYINFHGRGPISGSIEATPQRRASTSQTDMYADCFADPASDRRSVTSEPAFSFATSFAGLGEHPTGLGEPCPTSSDMVSGSGSIPTPTVNGVWGVATLNFNMDNFLLPKDSTQQVDPLVGLFRSGTPAPLAVRPDDTPTASSIQVMMNQLVNNISVLSLNVGTMGDRLHNLVTTQIAQEAKAADFYNSTHLSLQKMETITAQVNPMMTHFVSTTQDWATCMQNTFEKASRDTEARLRAEVLQSPAHQSGLGRLTPVTAATSVVNSTLPVVNNIIGSSNGSGTKRPLVVVNNTGNGSSSSTVRPIPMVNTNSGSSSSTVRPTPVANNTSSSSLSTGRPIRATLNASSRGASAGGATVPLPANIQRDEYDTDPPTEWTPADWIEWEARGNLQQNTESLASYSGLSTTGCTPRNSKTNPFDTTSDSVADMVNHAVRQTTIKSYWWSAYKNHTSTDASEETLLDWMGMLSREYLGIEGADICKAKRIRSFADIVYDPVGQYISWAPASLSTDVHYKAEMWDVSIPPDFNPYNADSNPESDIEIFLTAVQDVIKTCEIGPHNPGTVAYTYSLLILKLRNVVAVDSKRNRKAAGQSISNPLMIQFRILEMSADRSDKTMWDNIVANCSATHVSGRDGAEHHVTLVKKRLGNRLVKFHNLVQEQIKGGTRSLLVMKTIVKEYLVARLSASSTIHPGEMSKLGSHFLHRVLSMDSATKSYMTSALQDTSLAVQYVPVAREIALYEILAHCIRHNTVGVFIPFPSVDSPDGLCQSIPRNSGAQATGGAANNLTTFPDEPYDSSPIDEHDGGAINNLGHDRVVVFGKDNRNQGDKGKGSPHQGKEKGKGKDGRANPHQGKGRDDKGKGKGKPGTWTWWLVQEHQAHIYENSFYRNFRTGVRWKTVVQKSDGMVVAWKLVAECALQSDCPLQGRCYNSHSTDTDSAAVKASLIQLMTKPVYDTLILAAAALGETLDPPVDTVQPICASETTTLIGSTRYLAPLALNWANLRPERHMWLPPLAAFYNISKRCVKESLCPDQPGFPPLH